MDRQSSRWHFHIVFFMSTNNYFSQIAEKILEWNNFFSSPSRQDDMSYYSSRSSSRATDCKVYVGDLGNGAAKGELERAFSYYGPLRSVWVARNPPGFAFVEFEDPRDAEDAVKGMDGKWV